MKLSEHFSLSEFERSATATKLSYRANKSKNRHQVIHFMQKGGSR